MNPISAVLTGKTREHLVALPNALSDQHRLQPQAVQAFLGLQQQAAREGFNLQPASSFRDFERQRLIWNAKFRGERKVHDDAGNPILFDSLAPWQKCQAILRWSALPGVSRHHWGTELDVFDPQLLPPNQSLLLEPWEYEADGYFAELAEFLRENLPHFDFYLPFMELPAEKKIGREPWHISYAPLAEQLATQFSAAVLLESWQGEEIEGSVCLIENLPFIAAAYWI